MVAVGMVPSTANRKIVACSAYWRWLRKRAGLDADPWQGQQLSIAGLHRNGEKPKRAFTDGEVQALLSGPSDQEMHDAMRMAALRGMRLDEIYRLTAADCAGGWLDLRRSKTAAGRRRVPIHSDLAEIVDRRGLSAPASAYLFPEPGPDDGKRERSQALSQRFSRYRQSVGVHDRAEGMVARMTEIPYPAASAPIDSLVRPFHRIAIDKRNGNHV